MSVYHRLALLGLLLGGACRTPEDIERGLVSGDVEDSGEIVGHCRELLTPLTPMLASKLSYGTDTLFPLISGAHEVAMTWAFDQDPSRLIVGVSRMRAHFVRSRSIQAGPIGAYCTDHIAIISTLTLQTRDGLLDEDVPNVHVLAYGSDEAHATFRIAADDVRGEYVPILKPDQCLRELLVRVLIAHDGVHGTVSEIIVDPCDGPPTTPTQERLLGRWGVRYLHY